MLTRKTSLALGVELTEGTPLALADMTVVPVNASPSFSPEYGTTERMLATPDLTPRLAGEAFKSGQLQFEQELVGAASGPPEFDLALRACGYRRWTGKRLAIGTVTNGPAYPMMPFTQATSGVRGVLLSYVANGDSHVFIGLHENDDPADLTTGALEFENSPQTTIAVSSVGDTSYSYTPRSDATRKVVLDGVTSGSIPSNFELTQAVAGGTWRGRVNRPWFPVGTLYGIGDPSPGQVVLEFIQHAGTPELETGAGAADILVVGQSVTGQILQDDVPTQYDVPTLTGRMNLDGIELALAGMRGTFALRLRAGELPTFEFDMQGKALAPSDAVAGTFPESSILPPPVLGSTLQLGATPVTPCWEEVRWLAGNEVVLATCPSDVTGYRAAIIGSRKPQVSMDPEVFQEAVWPQFGNAYDMTAFRVVHALGSETGNRFQLEAWQAQYEQATPGDRAGKVTADSTLNLSGYGDDELVIHCY